MNRSALMKRVRTKNTEPELDVRKSLHTLGIRYRCHPKMPGTPDIYIPRLKLAIFVNGCFWHGHACPKGKLPKTNHEFWRTKIGSNVARDFMVRSSLEDIGIDSLSIWPCQPYENRRKLRILGLLYRSTPTKHGLKRIN